MMNLDQFRRLAEAYGGDLSRWPPDDRSGAETFAAVHARQAATILSMEAILDARLDAYQVALSSQLRERVLASAPSPRADRRAWRWVTATSLGLGLAASAAAGVAAGLTLSPPGVARLISGPELSNDALADLVGDAGEG